MTKRTAPPEDLADFCEQEYERLVRVLSLYCGSGPIAEELAHDALIKACRDWNRVKTMDFPRAWLHRVGMNLANSHFRRRSIERRVTEKLGASAQEAPDHSEAFVIRSVVAALPPRQRTVILLHYFDDLTYAQIGELLGCPANTAKSLARRAMESLRRQEQLGHLQEAGNVI